MSWTSFNRYFPRKDKEDGTDRTTEESDSDTGASGGTDAFTISIGNSGFYSITPTPLNPKPPAAAGPGVELQHATQEDPVTGWRGAQLRRSGPTVVLRPLNVTSNLTIKPQRAKCYAANGVWVVSHPPENHPAPAEDCTCGFYAMKDRTAPDVEGNILLRCDYYGKVIEHEHGYRAEWQRILGAWIPHSEHCQTGFLCENDPVGLSFKDGYAIPSCGDHKTKHLATLDQIGRRLGIPVLWEKK